MNIPGVGVGFVFFDYDGIYPLTRLDLAIAPDGSARASGAVPFPSGGTSVLLAVAPGPARCACADADGNGRSGITRVEVSARDPRSGDEVAVMLATTAGEDIDRPGRHRLDVRVGEGTATLAARVRPLRRRRRGRRRARR